MSTTETHAARCCECDEHIECCVFCEEEGCSLLVCYTCLIVAMGESVPQPHEHGG